MNEKEVIERLNRFKTIKVLYGNTFSMHLEQLEQLQNDIKTALNLIQTQQAEIEKKDKIIDLMAEFINKFDLDESICKDIKCNNDVTKQDCINCIKKYFFDTKKNIF